MTDHDTKYFGYSDAAKHPTEAIAGVRQVIVVMSDLLAGYRDPNDLGENPDSDTRSGIRFVFEACAMQLKAATQEIEAKESEAQTLSNIPDDFSLAHLDPADKLLVLCRMNGLPFDAIREGAQAVQGESDWNMRLKFDRLVTLDMSQTASAQFTITEPVEPSTERQSA